MLALRNKLIVLSKTTISKAFQKLSANVSGAYSYVFDAGENRFLFQSEVNEKLEGEVLKLNREKGLARLVQESQKANFYSANCSNTGRIFMIRKMAADIFFGLCVEKKPESIAKAELLMRANSESN